MSIHRIPDSDLCYHLVCFDNDACERADLDGSLASAAILSRLNDSAHPISDLLIACHGWMADVPAAQEQYDAWFGAAAKAIGDVRRVGQSVPDFAPLIVGLYWPSLPWGIEEMPKSEVAEGTLSVENAGVLDEVAASIADTEVARHAIQILLDEATKANSKKLTPAMHEAYATLFEESGLRADCVNGRPGSDLNHFEPQGIVDGTPVESTTDAVGDDMMLGIPGNLKTALLAPLRTLSFWKMKDRARQIGETGARGFLDAIQRAAPDARVHLMGHSFGCIVASGMVAGRHGDGLLEHRVDSLFLAQGALSLWSYASDIPYEKAAKGYYHRIVAQGLVRGPVITTRSVHDNAVGRLYPHGASVMAQGLLGELFPEYGGIGAYGIQGVVDGIPIVEIRMRSGDTQYGVNERGIYNIDASDVIRNGSGPAGAHSDIAHPEVAHAFWAGVTCGIDIARQVRQIEAQKRRHLEEAERHMERKRGARGGSYSIGGGLLSVEEESRTSSPAPVQATAPTQPSRWMNASIEGLELDQPLFKGQWYPLSFDVDIEARANSLIKTRILDGALTSPNSDRVFLTVQLDTDDFELSHSVSRISVPCVGRGQNKARFEFSPKRNGRATLKATILRDGNFIQQIILTFNVGANYPSAPDVTTRGRSLADAQLLEPRDVGLEISAVGNGYECTVWGPVYSHAHLTVSREYLELAINNARQALLGVIRQTVDRNPIFQTGIDIPDDVSRKALRQLAEAGSNLMYVLFEGADAGEDSKAVANFLRKLCGPDTPRLKMQIIAAKLPVPWTMLYLGRVGRADIIDWKNFLGMRHIVEQIPLQRSLNVWDHGIASDKPRLAVGVHLNQDIDAEIPGGFVQSQREFWGRMPFDVKTRLTSAHILQDFSNAAPADQILYFYCHAISRGLTEPGGPDASYLLLSDKSMLTLKDLRQNLPADLSLTGNPLVFINACESAELSSTFYDGFVPYFMSKGARGVIGTECLTPAFFATEYAKRFFIRFLGGQRLGEACLDLRREFMEEHGNPLGLLYAIHCDADTRILPPTDIAQVA
ncbi:CHAT domain-containing protein [Cupriavidus sp. RAF12]|uniref:CHAT domain-containing protein n=1 Tax=Cupriavidus sp. RAF12 TaxID=3233050 RepID=UPI003F92F718